MMVAAACSALAWLLLGAARASGDFYLGSSAVSQLTGASLERTFAASDRPMLVEFYSPTCPHCVSLTTTWKAVGKNLAGHVTVGAVNCAKEAICSQFNVKGVPSIKYLVKDAKGKRIVLDHTEERTEASFVAFAKRHMPSHDVAKISLAKEGNGIVPVGSFLAKWAAIPRIVLVKASSTLAPSFPFKSLAIHFKGRIAVAIASSSVDGAAIHQALLREGGASEAAIKASDSIKEDALYVVVPGGPGSSAPVTQRYEGALTFTAMKEHLEALLAKATESAKQEREKKMDL